MTDSERSLLAGCIRGDRLAWELFVKQYSNLVYHTIRKALSLHHGKYHEETIEDLYQEFFISILQNDCRKLAQFRGNNGCTLASWVGIIASRLTIDFLRRQKTIKTYTPEPPPSYASPSDDASIEHLQEASLVAALEALTAREQLIIQLHFQQGLDAEETSSLLRISLGAFYTQKSRLLDKLRKVIDKGQPL